MLHTPFRVWPLMMSGTLAIVFACAPSSAHAHVHWTQPNGVTSETIALYHFADATASSAPATAPLPADLALTSTDANVSLSPNSDTQSAIFAPSSLALPSPQTLRSTETVTAVDGNLTIECWFKWTPSMTSSTLEVGLQSGAKIKIARDQGDPSHDLLGVSGTHVSYIPAPGFVNWAAIGDEEASLNEWRHLGLTIHSTGIHNDPLAGHDVYSTGTIGRLYLNGHQTGITPGNTLDLAGLKVHDHSNITVVMKGGGIIIDEFTVWRKDWSDNGATVGPFSNGRGSASSAVADWSVYDGPQ